MEHIVSADGTAIGYTRAGAGPPLVLVHGMSVDHARWAPVLPALAAEQTVYALDRRGRGASGDGPAYGIAHEAADVVAVTRAAGAAVALLGHSYGGLAALEAAVAGAPLRALILYEPWVLEGQTLPPDLRARLAHLLAAGDRAAVVTTFLREGVGMPAAEIAALRAGPTWPVRLAAAHLIPREVRAVQDYRFDAARFATLAVPTLLLVGETSPAPAARTAAALQAALPRSRVQVLPGQGHIAMNTAPDLFLAAVLRFLRA